MLQFTEQAIDKLAFVYRAAPDGTVGLRIDAARGCKGLEYKMAFESQLGDNDEIVNAGPTPVVLSPMTQFLLLGTELSFADGPEGEGFVFNSPNSGSACGGCSSAGKC